MYSLAYPMWPGHYWQCERDRMSRPWFGRRGSSGRGSDSRGAPAPVGGPTLVDAAAPLITIDALGRKCPIPIIWLAEQIRDVPVGAVIAVLADDPAAYSDIPAWCSLKSHDCVFRADLPSGWSFGIRRRY
jgi:tRNA 2-thiouridine synthesizing protein A